MDFVEALKQGNLEAIRECPKADLHNHFVLGGSRTFLLEKTGRDIQPITNPLNSMDEMHAWNAENIGDYFNSTEGRKMLIRATFEQAKEDGVSILEIGEDVWGLGEFFHGDIDELVEAFETARKEIAPDIELRLQIGMSRHCDIAYLEDCLSHFWGCKAFYSIDLYGDELAQPIENFKSIYRRAKAEGLRLKAHVGEWGTAEDVRRAVEELELEEVQHGIAAVSDPSVIRFLVDNHIRLNITPSSNYLLGRVDDLKTHPIVELYHEGVDVTINSDDVLIFDSDVSKEYLRLYQSGCMKAEELDNIRKNGLKTIRQN
ncbi:amidohydrolase family protein [Butyrivibrio hungatei]|uniref:Adenosine deaminase Add n=1 Tax=Butyrivibrio hungatei TaxID=185008 RepID=A0A1D9P500_9FIRM|nr:adenosine deaminase [Butyrivibrio hungatei]AOZ97629.1 adenosine deaminase Add [Butyrivibrio hungatei]